MWLFDPTDQKWHYWVTPAPIPDLVPAACGRPMTDAIAARGEGNRCDACRLALVGDR
jgi:hypothetical protein